MKYKGKRKIFIPILSAYNYYNGTRYKGLIRDAMSATYEGY